MKQPPIAGWRDGSARHVKLLVGSKRDEWRLFSHFALGAGIDAAELPRQLGEWVEASDTNPRLMLR